MLYVVAIDLKCGCALVQLDRIPVKDPLVLPAHESYFSVQTLPRGFAWSELTYEEAFHLFNRLTHVDEGVIRSMYESPIELAETMRKYQG